MAFTLASATLETDVEKSGIVRLGDVVVRARLENLAQVFRAIVSGADEDVEIAAVVLLAEVAGEFQSAHAGELDVEHDERKIARAHLLDGGFRRIHGHDLVPARANHPFQKHPGRAVVFDKDDVQRGRFPE